jgi:hypothetical protein
MLVEFHSDFKEGPCLLISGDTEDFRYLLKKLKEIENNIDSEKYIYVENFLKIQKNINNTFIANKEYFLLELDNFELLISGIESIMSIDRPCHNYIDIHGFSFPIFLSKDEYGITGPPATG